MDNDKKKSIKKKITKVINTIIVVCGFILFMFGSLIVRTILDTSDKGKYKTLSEAEYKQIVNEYGDEATRIIDIYMKNNNNQIPKFDDIKDKISIPNYSVSCSNRIVNFDGSVYLSACSIKGYISNYDYEYGIYYNDSNNSNDNDNTSSSVGEIYIYKNTKADNNYWLVSKTQNSSNELTLLSKYSCKNKDCKALNTYNSMFYAVDNQEIILYDGEFILYNPVSKKSTTVTGLNISDVNRAFIICDKNGRSKFLAIEKDFGNHLYRIAYFDINKGQYITDFIYNQDSTNAFLLDYGYLRAYISENNTMYILNSNTGQVVANFKAASGIFEISLDNNKYFFINFGGASLGYLVDTNFNKVIDNDERYKISVNNDNTITLIFKDYFLTLNSAGKQIYKSGSYTSVIGGTDSYVIVRNESEVLVLNQMGESITKFFDYNDNYTFGYGAERIKIIEDNGKRLLEFVAVTKSDDGSSYLLIYHYNIDTHEITYEKTK